MCVCLRARRRQRKDMMVVCVSVERGGGSVYVCVCVSEGQRKKPERERRKEQIREKMSVRTYDVRVCTKTEKNIREGTGRGKKESHISYPNVKTSFYCIPCAFQQTVRSRCVSKEWRITVPTAANKQNKWLSLATSTPKDRQTT